MEDRGESMRKLITFDGYSGAGKSTQIKMLSSYLKEQGSSVIITGRSGHDKQRRVLADSLVESQFPFVSKSQHYVLRLLGQLIAIKSSQGDTTRPEKSGIFVVEWFWHLFLANPKDDQLLSAFRYFLNSFSGYEPDVSFYLDVSYAEIARRLVGRIHEHYLTDFVETQVHRDKDLIYKEGVEWISSRLPYFYVIDGIETEDAISNEIISILKTRGILEE